MFEKQPVKVYRVTLKKVISNLSQIKNCPSDQFKDEIEEAFEGYDYDDIEQIVGFDDWCDISKDGKYEVKVKVNHPNAYEITLHLEVKENYISITNVL